LSLNYSLLEFIYYIYDFENCLYYYAETTVLLFTSRLITLNLHPRNNRSAALPLLTLILAGLSIFLSLYVQHPMLLPSYSFFGVSTSYFTEFTERLFFHPSLSHLISNISFFLLFGLPVEQIIGNFRYFVTLFFLVLTTLLMNSLNIDISQLYGMSALVSGVIGIYAIILPHRKIGMIIPLGIWPLAVQVPAIIVILIWILTQLFFYWQEGVASQVSWLAHIFGFATGVFCGIFLLYSRNYRHSQ